MSMNKVWPLFLKVRIINAIVYLDILRNFLIPNFDEDNEEGSIFFQQDYTPSHCHVKVRRHLNTHFPNQWVSRLGQKSWPPGSSRSNSTRLFLWRFIKDKKVYFSFLTANIYKLRQE
jgi:hypothetical protein